MTRARAWLSGLFLFTCVLANDASAQQRAGVTRSGLDSLRANLGRRVRIEVDTASSTWTAGTLVAVNNENLQLDDRTFRTQSLIAAQRSTGRAYFNPSFVGFIVGALVGGTVGYVIGDNSSPSDEHNNGPQRATGIVIGSAAGGALGVLVGRRFAPEHWRDIRLR